MAKKRTVARSDWDGQITVTKGGRVRHVPLTRRLGAALAEHRHLRSPRVLCQDDHEPLTRQIVQPLVKRASRIAGLQHTGVRVLRHTFCSHLAMRDAPGRAIQELAGHQDMSVTQRYMHLNPSLLMTRFDCSTSRSGVGRRQVRVQAVEIFWQRSAFALRGYGGQPSDGLRMID